MLRCDRLARLASGPIPAARLHAPSSEALPSAECSSREAPRLRGLRPAQPARTTNHDHGPLLATIHPYSSFPFLLFSLFVHESAHLTIRRSPRRSNGAVRRVHASRRTTASVLSSSSAATRLANVPGFVGPGLIWTRTAPTTGTARRWRPALPEGAHVRLVHELPDRRSDDVLVGFDLALPRRSPWVAAAAHPPLVVGFSSTPFSACSRCWPFTSSPSWRPAAGLAGAAIAAVLPILTGYSMWDGSTTTPSAACRALACSCRRARHRPPPHRRRWGAVRRDRVRAMRRCWRPLLRSPSARGKLSFSDLRVPLVSLFIPLPPGSQVSSPRTRGSR